MTLCAAFADKQRMNKSIALMALLAMSLFSTGAEALSRLQANQAMYPGEQIVSANGAYILTLQATDGNLVLYRVADMKALWAAGSSGGTVAYMQQDRNFVVYNNYGTAVWNSNTYGSVVDTAAYVFVTDDGFAKIINSAGQTIWSVGGDLPPCTPSPWAACFNAGTPWQSSGFVWACDYAGAWQAASMQGATLGSCPYRPL